MRTNPEPTRKIYEAFRDGRTMHHGPKGGRLPGSLHVTANKGIFPKWSSLAFHDSVVLHWEQSSENIAPIVYVNLAGWGHSPCTREAINRGLAIMGIPHRMALRNGFITFADGILPHSGVCRVWPFPTNCHGIAGPSNAVIRRKCADLILAPSGGVGDWHRWKIRAKAGRPGYPGQFIVSAFRWNTWARAVEVYRFTVNDSGFYIEDAWEENTFLDPIGRNA